MRQMKMESPAATESPDSQNPENSFVWDEQSQLYFHASSGFYHDPNAGWYYSTRDGLYYKFEHGNYVLLPSHQGDNLETNNSSENPIQEDPFSAIGNTDCSSSDALENHPPPSEWLEDTLIELYLSGYPNSDANAGDHDMTVYPETYVHDGNNDSHDLNECTSIPEDYGAVIESSQNVSDTSLVLLCGSWEEENWRAQYGQVVQDAELPIPESSLISLWEWEMVTKPRNDGKGEVPRLVGRLAKQSAKLHPSLPSGGGLLKTAPICEVHLDLVRVTTGQVYKLRTPSKRYLASLSIYDSSNPTKDWGFPELSNNRESLPLPKSSVRSGSKTADGMTFSRGSSLLPDTAHDKLESYQYRDRAADRRALHGGYGVGPGQKNSVDGDSDRPTPSTEEAAAEALNMSFGVGSYARKVLESMGWKEGETLGKTTKGLVEPIQAQGNIGSAGLGWPQGRLKHR
uniref:uncharacterized protein LOC101311571 isoform X1 n=1 Tax=Fragaria vesca subsp. vesca TaxID=101020 RepID=UPI0005CAFA2A|nr:PREDICTED: uncharacterized protein LOC101311571 isoform X1 [Fragaria vesca subsp. vesca]